MLEIDFVLSYGRVEYLHGTTDIQIYRAVLVISLMQALKDEIKNMHGLRISTSAPES